MLLLVGGGAELRFCRLWIIISSSSSSQVLSLSLVFFALSLSMILSSCLSVFFFSLGEKWDDAFNVSFSFPFLSFGRVDSDSEGKEREGLDRSD